jgi:hypothetical protein
MHRKFNLTKTKTARQMKSKSKIMLIIVFDIKGTVYKEFVQQAKQSILHITVTIYGNCMKICEDQKHYACLPHTCHTCMA